MTVVSQPQFELKLKGKHLCGIEMELTTQVSYFLAESNLNTSAETHILLGAPKNKRLWGHMTTVLLPLYTVLLNILPLLVGYQRS